MESNKEGIKGSVIPKNLTKMKHFVLNTDLSDVGWKFNYK
jgi:hypothetical protein